MALKLIESSSGPSDNAVGDYLKTINADAEPGELVHMRANELDELQQFSRRFEGVGLLGRAYEEITHQQHMASRWHAAYLIHRKHTNLWRLVFLITTFVNLGFQVSRLFT